MRMEQLTANRLNDQIVSMRKEVKRAIVHQIHRLTTAAKRLRNKKGTEEQKQKNLTKADNMVAEIMIVKKMKPDDVSVFGLTNFEEVDIKNFMSKRVIAPETKAMAKLCLRKNLRTVIDQFIKEIGSEHSCLLELLDKRQQNKEKKENKKQKKQEQNEEINHAFDNTSDSTLDSSSESIPDLIPVTSDSNLESGNEKLNLGNNINNTNDDVDKMVDIDNNLDVPHNVRMKPVQKEKNIQESSNSDSNNEKINYEDSSDNQKDKHIKINRIENKPLERKNIDPFFMTSDNSKYLTYCNIEANAKKENDESDKSKISDDKKNFKNDFKRGSWKKSYSKDDSFNRNRNNQRFDSRKTITYLGGSGRNSFDKKGLRRGEKRPLNKDPPSNVKLHPSWEAKKKLSASAASFQGKKITFDD